MGIKEKRGLKNIFINLIQDIYEGLRNSVKSLCGVTEHFNVGACVHQESVLNPYWLSVVMYEVAKDI
jgi:hypothetical protein